MYTIQIHNSFNFKYTFKIKNPFCRGLVTILKLDVED